MTLCIYYGRNVYIIIFRTKTTNKNLPHNYECSIFQEKQEKRKNKHSIVSIVREIKEYYFERNFCRISSNFTFLNQNRQLKNNSP